MNTEETIKIFTSITEKAARASFDWIGKNNAKEADAAATKAMRLAFKSAPIDGSIVIGEGERDKAPMLYIGEKVGKGSGFPEKDIAVDPLEGTGLCAKGLKGVLCVLAVSDKGHLLHAPDVYMNKLACKTRNLLSIKNSASKNIHILSKVLNKNPSEIKVAVLDRPRHKQLIDELKSLKVKLTLFQDGDLMMSLLTSISDKFKNPIESIDLLLGSGGAPEGVISAAALKNLGGDFQGQLVWENDSQKLRAEYMGMTNPDQVLGLDDLSKGEAWFFATAVTSGPFLKGLQISQNKVFAETLVIGPHFCRIVRSIPS